jgi:hypothetical protein
MRTRLRLGHVMCLLVVGACSSGADGLVEVMPEGPTSSDEVSDTGVNGNGAELGEKAAPGPGSFAPAAADELVAKGSAEQRSEVNLLPVLDSGSKASLRLVYYEHPEGGLAAAAVEYATNDANGPLVLVQIPYEIDEEWTFDGSGGLEVRVDGSVRSVTGGSMRLTGQGTELRIEFRDLEFAGTGAGPVEGYVAGVAVEQCFALVEQTPPNGSVAPVNSAAPDTRIPELDENWESDFCSSVQRLSAAD